MEMPTLQEMVNRYRTECSLSSEGGRVFLLLKGYSADDLFEIVGNEAKHAKEIAHGSGKIHPENWPPLPNVSTCPVCKGKGTVSDPNYDYNGVTCTNCNGTGKIKE